MERQLIFSKHSKFQLLGDQEKKEKKKRVYLAVQKVLSENLKQATR